MILATSQTRDFRAHQFFVRTCASWGHLPVLKPGPLALLQCEGCGSQACHPCHPCHSHCNPSPCPTLPTCLPREPVTAVLIMSHCPECPASPSPSPGPWVDVPNACPTGRGRVQGRQRLRVQSLVLNPTNPTSVPPNHSPPWMGAGVCLEMTLDTSAFFALDSGCLLGLTPLC